MKLYSNQKPDFFPAPWPPAHQPPVPGQHWGGFLRVVGLTWCLPGAPPDLRRPAGAMMTTGVHLNYMAQPPNERKCLACGGPRRIEGNLGAYKHTFMPQGRFVWMGYKVKASVCLDCGFVAHYVDQGDLPELGNGG